MLQQSKQTNKPEQAARSGISIILFFLNNFRLGSPFFSTVESKMRNTTKINNPMVIKDF